MLNQHPQVTRTCLCLLAGALLLNSGCRKPKQTQAEVVPTAPVSVETPPEAKAGSAAAPSGPAAPATEDAVAKFRNSSEFADLTKAYQVFYLQKKRHTSDLQELVRERYLRSIPPPPPGKNYAVDQKNLKVILVP